MPLALHSAILGSTTACAETSNILLSTTQLLSRTLVPLQSYNDTSVTPRWLHSTHCRSHCCVRSRMFQRIHAARALLCIAAAVVAHLLELLARSPATRLTGTSAAVVGTRV